MRAYSVGTQWLTGSGDGQENHTFYSVVSMRLRVMWTVEIIWFALSLYVPVLTEMAAFFVCWRGVEADYEGLIHLRLLAIYSHNRQHHWTFSSLFNDCAVGLFIWCNVCFLQEKRVCLFFIFIELIEVTLVKKIIEVSGAQFHDTSSGHCIVCSPPPVKSPSITLHPPLPASTSLLSLW